MDHTDLPALNTVSALWGVIVKQFATLHTDRQYYIIARATPDSCVTHITISQPRHTLGMLYGLPLTLM